MQITIYNDFRKPANSTLRPENSTQTIGIWELNVLVKEESDIFSPVFLISPSTDDGSSSNFSPSQSNYVYCSAWSRYYFIDHIVWFGVSWEVHCTIDTLATYRNRLMNESYYITRTSCPTLINHKLIDVMFPADNDVTTVEASTNMPIVTDGTYIVGVIGAASVLSKVGGAVAYYAMSYAQLSALIEYLFNTTSYTNIGTDDIVQTFFNPIQYIVSCKWVPFNITGSNVTRIRFGWWNTTNISCQIITNYTQTFTLAQNLAITHPYPSDLTDYRNSAVYCHYHLYIPFCGDYQLPTELLQKYTYIGVRFVIDPISCDIIGEVKAGNGAEFQWSNGKHVIFFQSNAGCDIALAQGSIDYARVLESGVNAIQSLFTLNVSGALSNVIDGVQASQPVISKLGGNGSRALGEVSKAVTLYTTYRSVNTISREGLGQPCGKYVKLSQAEGYYVQISNPYIEVSASTQELNDIEEKMKGGFWCE